MTIEVTEGAQGTVDAVQRMLDQSLPVEDRYSPDFTDHDPAAGQPDGATGPAWYWAQFGRAFSDIDQDVIETIMTPTKLITVMNLSGTHTGAFLVMPLRANGSPSATCRWSAFATGKPLIVGARPTSSASSSNSA